MLLIGGLQELSLIDYPGKIAAVVFCQGCNFRCSFCHNPELVLPEKFSPCLREDKVFQFLEKRQNKLQGVVVTGGEPTIQPGLADFLTQIKSLGFFVKLDTNGYEPKHLAKLIEKKLIDYVAMDIKAPINKYDEVAGVAVDLSRIINSIDIIIGSGIDYQFRTTAVKKFIKKEDIESILVLLKSAKYYRLQRFVNRSQLLDSSLLDVSEYTECEFQELENLIPASITR